MPPDAPSPEPIEPIVRWLFGFILLLLALLIAMDRADKSDAQIFQVIAQLVSAFSGALLMRIQPRKPPPEAAPPPSTRVEKPDQPGLID